MPINAKYRPKYETKTFCDVWDELEDFKNDLQDSPFSDILTDTNQTLLYYLLYAKYGNSPIANRDENQFKFKVFGTIFEYGPTWQKRLELQDTLRNLTELEILKGGIDQLTGSDTNTGSRLEQGTNGGSENGGGSNSNSTTSSSERDISNTGTQTSDNDGIDVKNHAANPPTSPVASSTAPLTYIDGQDYNTIDNTSIRTDNLKTDDDTTSSSSSTQTISNFISKNYATAATVNINNLTNISRSYTRSKDLVKAYTDLWDLLKTDVTSDFLKKFAKCFKLFVGADRTWAYITEDDEDA